MPIIIFGTRNRTVSDQSGNPKTTVCGSCGNVVSLEPVRMRRYFALFFIPLIPLGNGRAGYRCPQCQALYHRQEPS